MRITRLIVLVGLMALACDLGVGADGGLTGWDWASAIARDAVDLAYGEHWYVSSFGAEYLDISGDLYEDIPFPEWDVYYSDGSYTLLWVIIHPDGRYSIFEFDGYGASPLNSTYSSEAVASWLRTASRVYRELTGLTDDVCYVMNCWCEEEMDNCDLVAVGLYDVDLERLAVAYLLAQTGEITGFNFY
ncbi:MAG TPA: hypothetical protein VM054_01815 [bacterium]|nr:hypothetical protein [bacterium]